MQLFHTYSSTATASPAEVSRRRHPLQPLQPSLEQPSSPHAVAAQALCRWHLTRGLSSRILRRTLLEPHAAQPAAWRAAQAARGRQ